MLNRRPRTAYVAIGVVLRRPSMHPVIHGIGISKAMHSVVAVTEGHNRRPREGARCGTEADG